MHNLSHKKLVYVSIKYYTLIPITVVARVHMNFAGPNAQFMPFSPDFNQAYIFPTGFSNISEHKLHVNLFQREPSTSMLADTRTGIPKLIVAFSNFAYAPKNTCFCCQYVILVDEIELRVGKGR